jgi:hypothetical protein
MMLLLIACTGPKDGDTPTYPEHESAGGFEGPGDDGDGGDEEPVDNDFLFEGIQTFAIEMDAMAMAGLASTPDQDVDKVHADFIYDGQTWHVGLKLRGGENSFRTIDGKASFKIDFNEFEPDSEFYGLKAITLLNMVQDPSMISEHVGYALYDAVGIESPRHGYARVTVNGTDYGLYGVIEPVDKRFVKRRWADDDGPLFEGENADLLTTDLARFSTDPEDRAPLDALVATLDANVGDTWQATLDDRFGADNALRHVAVDLVSGNADAYTTRVNNWFLYYDPTNDQWSTMPWGLDRAFRTDLDVTSLYRGRLYQDCWTSTSCSERFREIVEEVLGTWESMDLAGFASEVATEVHEDCVNDPRGPGGCDIDQPLVLDWIANRPAAVRTQLDAVAP